MCLGEKNFNCCPSPLPPLKGILIRMDGEQYQTKLKFLAREHGSSTGLGRPVKVFTRFEPTCLNRGEEEEISANHTRTCSSAFRCLLGWKKGHSRFYLTSSPRSVMPPIMIVSLVLAKPLTDTDAATGILLIRLTSILVSFY